MDKIKIAFFDSKDYDKQSFVDSNQNEEFEITYFGELLFTNLL